MIENSFENYLLSLNTNLFSPKDGHSVKKNVEIFERKSNFFRNSVSSKKPSEYSLGEKELIFQHVVLFSNEVKTFLERRASYFTMRNLFQILYNFYFYSNSNEEKLSILDLAEKELYIDMSLEREIKSFRTQINPLPISKNIKTIYLLSDADTCDGTSCIFYDKEKNTTFVFPDEYTMNDVLTTLGIDMFINVDKSLSLSFSAFREAELYAQDKLDKIRSGEIILGEKE